MGFGHTRAVALRGVNGFVVDVEAHVAQGLPGFAISGLGDSAVKQSSDRIKAVAATIEGLPVSQRRVTVNLSPAGERKVGTGFDLGIFVAVAAAMGVVKDAVVADVVHIGEIGLDGTVRAVPGVLPLVRAAALTGVRHVVVPVANAAEARLVRGVRVHPVAEVAELVRRYDALRRGRAVEEVPVPPGPPPGPVVAKDLSEVVGQADAKLALEIAAAGGHHLLLAGPPGAGKTMLAERLPGVLPGPRRRGVDGGDRDPLGPRGARLVRRGRAAHHPAALRRTTPRRVAGRCRRRGDGAHPTGGDHAGAPRGSLPG